MRGERGNGQREKRDRWSGGKEEKGGRTRRRSGERGRFDPACAPG